MKIWILIGLLIVLIALSGCEQSCEEYIEEYIQENSLSQEDVYNNGQGFWSVEKDGEQLTNCLGKGGKVNMYFPLEEDVSEENLELSKQMLDKVTEMEKYEYLRKT